MKPLLVLRKFWYKVQLYISFEKIISFVIQIFTLFFLFLLIVLLITQSVTSYKKYVLDFSNESILNFININIISHKEILSIIFAIFGMYLIVIRIREMSFANIIKAREEWKNELFQALDEIEKTNNYMADHFRRCADDIYLFIYKFDMKTKDRIVLELFFNKFISNSLLEFEHSAIETKILKKYYDDPLPYSFQHIKSIIPKLISPHYTYYNYKDDFKELYINKFKSLKMTQSD